MALANVGKNYAVMFERVTKEIMNDYCTELARDDHLDNRR